jgi:hypothetical protein
MDAVGQARECDYVACDGYTDWHGLYFPSYAAKHARASTQGGAFEILTSRFNHTWDFSLRPAAQMAYEAYTAVASGGAAILDDEPYHDGALESEVYDRLRPIYAEIAQREHLLREAVPLKYAAVYHSLLAREVEEMLADGRAQTESDRSASSEGDLPPFPESETRDGATEAEFLGAVRLLTDAHIPVEIIHSQDLTREALREFRVVYLPNAVVLSAVEADLLSEYVAEGGGLVATFQTGLFTNLGERLSDFASSGLLEVTAVEKGNYTFPYVKFSGGNSRPVPHYGQVMHVRPLGDGEPHGELIRPIIENPTGETYYANNKPAPFRPTSYPFSVWTEKGKGRVVYCAGQPEVNYGLLCMPEYRDWARKALTWAARRPPEYELAAPAAVEMSVMRQPNRDIVHLIACQPSKQLILRGRWANVSRSSTCVESVAPLLNGCLGIPAWARRVTVEPGATELKMHRNSGRVHVDIPHVGAWTTVVVER